LGDSGYPLEEERILVRYKGSKYHQADFTNVNESELSNDEFFNKRHSSARVTIERVNGLFKKKFGIFQKAIPYSPPICIQIIYGCACLYNFVFDREWTWTDIENVELCDDEEGDEADGDLNVSNSVGANEWRDQLRNQLILGRKY